MKLISLMFAGALMLGAQASSAQTATITGTNHGGVSVQSVAVHGGAGSPISVVVRYAGLSATGNAQVTYTTEGALKLNGPVQKPLTPDSKGAYQDTVVVQAAADGAYFLNVFATSAGRTSILSIPVTVGSATFKAKAPAAASAVSAAGGQRVIEMPAQETRR